MKGMLLLLSALILSATAQENEQMWKGYLIDQMCAQHMSGERADYYAKRHTRSCNFHDDCKASGFGIMVNGAFLKLTKASSARAIAYLESVDARNSIYVTVRGTMVEDEIEAKKIETAKEPEDE